MCWTTKICSLFNWNRYKWRRARFAIVILIGFQRCTKIHIKTDSLLVQTSVPPSLSPFFLYTKLLTHISQGLWKYCKTAYPRSRANQINSKKLLKHLKSPNFNHIAYIVHVKRINLKSIDFSTVYTCTTWLHENLKAGSQLLSMETQYFQKLYMQEQDKSSDIEQQPHFGGRKYTFVKQYTASKEEGV